MTAPAEITTLKEVAQLLGEMRKREPDVKKSRMLEWAEQIVIAVDKQPPTMALAVDRGHCHVTFPKVPGYNLMDYSVEPPAVETLPSGRARLVINLPDNLASTLRAAFNFSTQPAPLEASEAIVRATHALAGAAIELTHVMRSLKEKL